MRSVALFVTSAAAVVALAALHRNGLPGGGRRPGARPHGAGRGAPPWVGEALVLAQLPTDADRAWRVVRVWVPAALALLALVGGPVVALGLAGALAAAFRLLRPALRRHLLERRDQQLPDWLERLASSLRAGSAPTTAFVELAGDAPEPLGSDLRSIASELQHGAGMAAAVDRWAERPGASAAVRLTAAALGLSVRAGGEVARSMDRVAATLRERRQLQAEARSLATQARASAAVLGVAPLGFTGLVSTTEPEMVRFLVTTPIGLLCLTAGLGLEAAGMLWMSRIVGAAS